MVQASTTISCPRGVSLRGREDVRKVAQRWLRKICTYIFAGVQQPRTEVVHTGSGDHLSGSLRLDQNARVSRRRFTLVLHHEGHTMAVHKLSPDEQFAIPPLQKKMAEARRSARDTIRAAEKRLLRAEALVLQSESLVDRARRTLDKLEEERRQRKIKSSTRKRLQ